MIGNKIVLVIMVILIGVSIAAIFSIGMTYPRSFELMFLGIIAIFSLLFTVPYAGIAWMSRKEPFRLGEYIG